jgi:hypothetical protein
MAGPVITTLLTPTPASGSATVVVGTEDVLASGTASGTYVLTLETINMADGDVLEIRGYDKPGGSATQRQVIYYSLANGQGDPGHISPPILTEGFVQFSIKQTAGTARTFNWSVLNLNGV